MARGGRHVNREKPTGLLSQPVDPGTEAPAFVRLMHLSRDTFDVPVRHEARHAARPAFAPKNPVASALHIAPRVHGGGRFVQLIARDRRGAELIVAACGLLGVPEEVEELVVEGPRAGTHANPLAPPRISPPNVRGAVLAAVDGTS